MSHARDEGIVPYKVLFPIGILSAALGLILWIFFQARFVNFYPRAAHANLMYFGFLWSFVAGFLMTAVPRMTASFHASVQEIAMAVLLVFLQLVFNFRNNIDVSVAIYVLQTLFLIFFLVRRFLIKKRIPFEGFFFVPFAFSASFVGISLWYTGKPEYLFLFAGEAFILNLIFGLGSRLIPVLSRLPNALSPDANAGGLAVKSTLAWALWLNLSFILQVFVPKLGIGMRLAFVIAFSIWRLKILEKPRSFSALAAGFRFSIVFLILSFGLQLIPTFPMLAAQHLTYVGGLVLITLMVATRVMLAHGGQSLDYELESKRLWIVLGCISLAAILRAVAGVEIVGLEMRVSIYLLLIGISLWGFKFVKVLLHEEGKLT